MTEPETPLPHDPEPEEAAGDALHVHNPHDVYFKAIFGDAEVAAGEFRALLPPAILEGIDLTTIEPRSTNFISAEMAETHSDALFSVRAKGREALVYVLIEHRSTPDPMLPFRMLGYMVQVWEAWLRNNQGARHLPMVIPLVLFQGPKPWPGPWRLAELIDLPAGELQAVREQLPDFRFLLDDLAVRSESELEARPMPTAGVFGLVLLKRAREPEPRFRAALRQWLKPLRQAPNWAKTLGQAFGYIVNVSDEELEELFQIVADELDEEAREVVMTTAEKLRAEGRAEGELRARRETLLEMLEERFGAPSREMRERVEGATLVQLKAWTRQILSASTLEAVFADPS